PINGPAPQAFRNDAVPEAKLVVMHRDRGENPSPAGQQSASIAGWWDSVIGAVRFKHEPIAEKGPLEVRGWLVTKGVEEEFQLEGEFDPQTGVVQLKFADGSERNARFKLSPDGRKLSGEVRFHFPGERGTGSNPWLLRRRELPRD